VAWQWQYRGGNGENIERSDQQRSGDISRISVIMTSSVSAAALAASAGGDGVPMKSAYGMAWHGMATAIIEA